MDYSESLIAIQTAKDKASQACRERDWAEAQKRCAEMQRGLNDLALFVGLSQRRWVVKGGLPGTGQSPGFGSESLEPSGADASEWKALS